MKWITRYNKKAVKKAAKYIFKHNTHIGEWPQFGFIEPNEITKEHIEGVIIQNIQSESYRRIDEFNKDDHWTSWIQIGGYGLIFCVEEVNGTLYLDVDVLINPVYSWRSKDIMEVPFDE